MKFIMLYNLMADNWSVIDTHIHVKFGFVSSIMIFEHNNLL